MSGNSRHEGFCAIITEGLKRESMSLRELCRRSRIDPSLLSKMLAGKRNPPQDDETLSALARALNESEDEVFLSVGRLPSSWSRLCSDRNLRCRVVEMLSGRTARPGAVIRAIAGSDASAGPSRRDAAMPDELL